MTSTKNSDEQILYEEISTGKRVELTQPILSTDYAVYYKYLGDSREHALLVRFFDKYFNPVAPD